VTLALLAVMIEAAAGYPDALYRAVGHPVGWIGRLIAWCDRNWNLPEYSAEERRLRGAVTLAILLVVSLVVGFMIVRLLGWLLPGVVGLPLLALIASTLLAQRSLHQHVSAVAEALEGEGTEAGRRAVSMIVGRDTSTLDEPAICRAAIESLAENFSDGVVAPLFWLVVAGLPGAIAYKAVNTADSMIGHKSEKYLAFGWASARFDDLVNLPASRLSAVWLVLAAALSRLPVREAIDVTLRDAPKHRSPNAGWPEAAMAGALGIRLAGPRIYGGVAGDFHWVGNGNAELGPRDIRNALVLYRTACAVQIAVLALLSLAVWAVARA
jgi:adenosylcobinamide-phosphate synthase